MRLADGHIGSNLDASGATLTNEGGPALYADGLRVDRDLYLRGIAATGAGEHGAVRLAGAHIGGQLDATDAWLNNNSGPALNADGLDVESLLLQGAFVAIGDGDGGAVRLVNADIGGQLNAAGAVLGNTSGPALIADSLRVGQHLFLTGGSPQSGPASSARCCCPTPVSAAS